MATNPFTPVAGSKASDSPRSHVGLHIVSTAVHKYAEYLSGQARERMDLVITEGKRRVRKTYIEVADHFYNQIPEDHR